MFRRLPTRWRGAIKARLIGDTAPEAPAPQPAPVVATAAPAPAVTPPKPKETPPAAVRRRRRASTLGSYLPRHTDRGIYSMHVPKTAGSFVNSLFVDALGAENCDPFMARGIRAANDGDLITPTRADYVSAHVNYHMVRCSGLADHYGMILVLRDPVDRLVSHLNWIDRFNHGHDPAGYRALDDDYRRLVQTLKQIDPENPGALNRLFRLDLLAKAVWLYNRQMATLAVQRPHDILQYTDIDRMTDAEIRARMADIEVCATLKQFLDGLAARGIALPEKTRVNPGLTRKFTRTPELEAAAERYVAQDQRLWDLTEAQTPDLDRVAGILRAGQGRRPTSMLQEAG